MSFEQSNKYGFILIFLNSSTCRCLLRPAPSVEDVFFFLFCMVLVFLVKVKYLYSGLVWLSWVFCLFKWIWKLLFQSIEKIVGILMVFSLILKIAFGKVAIVTMLILCIHEHGRYFHLLISSSKIWTSGHAAAVHLSTPPPPLPHYVLVASKYSKSKMDPQGPADCKSS